MESYLQLLPKGVDDYLAKFVHKVDTIVRLEVEDESNGKIFILRIKHGEFEHSFTLGFGTIKDLEVMIERMDKKQKDNKFFWLELGIGPKSEEMGGIYLSRERCDDKTKFYISTGLSRSYINIDEQVFNQIIKICKITLVNTLIKSNAR